VKLAEGDPKSALELLESGLRLWPNNAGARYVAGQAALQLGDLQRALAEYREATRIDDGATDAALAMARIYYSLHKYPAALQFAERHISTHPFVNEDAHVIAIRAAAEQENWQKTETLLTNLNARESMRNIVVVEHAGVMRKKSGYEAAISIVENSGLDLEDAANTMALTSLSLDLIALDRQDEALRRVDKALVKNPTHPRLLDVRARLLARMARDEEALASVEKALASDPDFAPALEVKAVYADQAGRLEEALALYDRAAAADDENSDYAYRAAGVALKMGNNEDGIRRLRKVVSLSPGHVAAVNDLAWRLAESGQELDLALELAKRAIQLDRQAEVLDTLGFVQLKRGDADAAIEAFEASLAERPDSPSVRYRLAMAQTQRGDSAAARDSLAKALEEDSFPEVQAARAELARLEND
jgi:tetratricopeptide (TPR) repeat protein